MSVADSMALITFNDVGLGLSTFGKTVECFEVAGQDSVYYPAKMLITKKQLQLWSPKVKVPIAIRYGFRNFPKTEGYLFSTAGLPIPSFRTDNWFKVIIFYNLNVTIIIKKPICFQKANRFFLL